LTNEAVRLIVPDEQLLRLGYTRSYTRSDVSESHAVGLIVPDKQLILPVSSPVSLPEILIPKRRGRLFFFDETDICWCPDTGRIYHTVGKQAKIDSPGENETKYILGSLEYPSGEGLYEIYPRKRHQEFRAHLEHLMEMCPDDFLFVVRDNASSHVTPKLDEFLIGNKDRLCLVPLPTRSPHLNLIERLWHYMRDNITRNHFYATFKELCETWVNWLQTLPFERFVSLMGCQKHLLKVFS
jgi:hypothetical protein